MLPPPINLLTDDSALPSLIHTTVPLLPQMPPPLQPEPALGLPALGSPILGSPAMGSPAMGSPALGSPGMGSSAMGSPALEGNGGQFTHGQSLFADSDEVSSLISKQILSPSTVKKKKNPKMREFVFLLGQDPNRHLLDFPPLFFLF